MPGKREPGKRQTKLWKARKRAVAAMPNYLRTVAISKPGHFRMPGTFGAASEVVHIDPATGRPRGEA